MPGKCSFTLCSVFWGTMADWSPQLNQVTNGTKLPLLYDSRHPLICFRQHNWSRQDSLVTLLIWIGYRLYQIVHEDFKTFVRFSYNISSSIVKKRNKASHCNIFSHMYSLIKVNDNLNLKYFMSFLKQRLLYLYVFGFYTNLNLMEDFRNSWMKQIFWHDWCSVPYILYNGIINYLGL